MGANSGAVGARAQARIHVEQAMRGAAVCWLSPSSRSLEGEQLHTIAVYTPTISDSRSKEI